MDIVGDQIQHKDVINTIIHAALDAADPYQSVKRNVSAVSDELVVAGKHYPLTASSKVVLVGLGKAAPLMVTGALEKIGPRVTQSLCVTKHLPENPSGWGKVTTIIGNHPVPGEGSMQGGKAIQAAVTGLMAEDVVILLLSGGGSSLATIPAEGIEISGLQSLTNTLLRSGATINEMNCVRKHLDLLKGGGLLKMSSPARVAALILSDVVGSPLDVIASGPTVPDPTTFEQALSIVESARLSGSIPHSIIEYLQQGRRGEIPETVKPDDPITGGLHNIIIGSNSASCLAAVSKARELGLDAKLVSTELIGEARLAGEFLADQARIFSTLMRPFLRVYGGETTVTVKGIGVGGRNLETALAAAEGLRELEGIALVTLATDGEDGPSGAAGAVVTCETIGKARSMGIDAADHLRRNDSYSFFLKVGGLLITGSTGTNVNDINFIFGF